MLVIHTIGVGQLPPDRDQAVALLQHDHEVHHWRPRARGDFREQAAAFQCHLCVVAFPAAPGARPVEAKTVLLSVVRLGGVQDQLALASCALGGDLNAVEVVAEEDAPGGNRVRELRWELDFGKERVADKLRARSEPPRPQDTAMHTLSLEHRVRSTRSTCSCGSGRHCRFLNY